MTEFQEKCIKEAIELGEKLDREYEIYLKNQTKKAFDYLSKEFPDLQIDGKFLVLDGARYGCREDGYCVFGDDISYCLYDLNNQFLRFSSRASYGNYLMEKEDDRCRSATIEKEWLLSKIMRILFGVKRLK